MVNVVIADDEIKICQLIQALGKWDELGMKVVGTAANGLEALRLLKEYSVDVLITDIRMPGCDGIQLIDRVRKISPETKIIIISGYAEFSYAQAAVQYGVTDYLLKPINENLLNDALRKIQDMIGRDKEREEIFASSKIAVETNTATIRSTLILDCITESNRSFGLDELKEHYHFKAQEGCFQFIVSKIDGVIEKEQLDFIWDNQISILSNQIKNLCNDLVCLKKNYYLFAILNYPKNKEDTVRKALRDTFHRAKGVGEIFRDVKLFNACGKVVTTPKDLGKSYTTSLRTIKERIISDTGRLLEYKESRGMLYDKQLLDRYSWGISNILEVCSQEELEGANRKLFDSAMHTDGVCGWEIFELIDQAGSMFLMRVNVSNKNDRLEEFRMECDNCSSAEQLYDTFNCFTQNLLHAVAELREGDSTRTIRLAKLYIQNHYSQPISLEEVSSHLGLTTAYFSTLFKKKTGVGFAKYLMNTRVEAAKVLLKDTNDSVSDICKAVGYMDLKNFNKVFEQTAGVKPTVYRDIYG
ncbi:MAG: response regulator [Pseudobutyrivibrio sp.]|nr:response regulator [Pseudobutyrivibrio sp.]